MDAGISPTSTQLLYISHCRRPGNKPSHALGVLYLKRRHPDIADHSCSQRESGILHSAFVYAIYGSGIGQKKQVKKFLVKGDLLFRRAADVLHLSADQIGIRICRCLSEEAFAVRFLTDFQRKKAQSIVGVKKKS